MSSLTYNIHVSLVNYRCFTDPVRFTIGNGITSIIGPNNVGKTSILRFFHEFKGVFAQLMSDGQLTHFLQHEFTLAGNYSDVDDSDELFNNSVEAPLVVDIALEPIGPTPEDVRHLLKFRFTRKRGSTNLDLSISDVREHILARGALSAQSGWIRHGTNDLCHMRYFSDFCKAIYNSIYIGASRTVVHASHGPYYGLEIGASFITAWNDWKNGKSKSKSSRAMQVTEDIRRIFSFNTLEINASADGSTIQLQINGRTYRMGELGSGIGQFIFVLGQAAMKTPDFIFIDEPESALHPSMQMQFLMALASYAKVGTAYTTHSIGLARSTSDNIYSLHLVDGTVRCTSFEQTYNYPEFLGQMSFASFRELGFDRILLVEGTTDLKLINQMLRKLNKEHTTLILPLGGASMINGACEHELAEILRISQNVSVVIDSERASAHAPLSKDREDFVSICKRLGYRSHVTELRATDNYLPDRAVKAVKGDGFRGLDPFERLGDRTKGGWSKSDNWKIANRMTSEELLASDLGQFLNRI